MRIGLLVAASAAAIVGAHASADAADSTGSQLSCLQAAAAKCRPGKWIRVLRSDSSQVEGGLVSIQLEQGLLTLEPWSGGQRARMAFRSMILLTSNTAKGVCGTLSEV
jgi:hypothetical protein